MTSETLCPVCGQDNGPETGGCDCYGIPEPLPPYYPPTAVLRAFRAAIHAPASLDTLHPPATMPNRYDAEARPLASRAVGRPVAGAWADERANGIGAVGDGPDEYKRRRLDGVGIHARREASALRSRAFARVDGALKTDAWRREWAGIQELYAPRSRRPRTR